MGKTDIIEYFFGYVRDLLGKVAETQRDALHEAAQVVAECIRDEEKGSVCHVWGTGGHSSILTQETLCRKGGLACVNPILDPGISLGHGAMKAIFGLEGVKGYAAAVLDYRRVKAGDVLIIGSPYGVNTVTVEAALTAKSKDVTVIAVTSPAFSKTVDADHPVRHESRKNLAEVADIVIDSLVPPEDAILQLDGLDLKVSPISTIIHSALFQCLEGLIVEKLLDMGVEPKIWTSSLVMGGAEANQALKDQYFGVFKNL